MHQEPNKLGHPIRLPRIIRKPMPRKIDRDDFEPQPPGKLIRKVPPAVTVGARFVQQQHAVRSLAAAKTTQNWTPGESELKRPRIGGERTDYVPHSLCL